MLMAVASNFQNWQHQRLVVWYGHSALRGAQLCNFWNEIFGTIVNRNHITSHYEGILLGG